MIRNWRGKEFDYDCYVKRLHFMHIPGESRMNYLFIQILPQKPERMQCKPLIQDINSLKQGAWNACIICTDKSLAWPTSQCILFDGENISFDASLVIYI